MKYAIILGALLAFLLFYIRIVRGSDLVCDKAFLTSPEIIEQDGYPFEEHNVTTDDGYILTMHRIPNPGGVPILLVHGLLEASHTWILLGPKTGNDTRARALGYQLHDLGYDIWLGNTRGNKYSRGHEYLDPDAWFDTDYWDFSFPELGKYDLPAMIDYITEETDYEKIHYVGHSQGTTSFFAMGAIRPEYNSKIISVHALAPVVFLEHAKSPLLSFLSTVDISLAFSILGNREVLDDSYLMELAGQVACNSIEPLDLCQNLLLLVFGWGSTQTSDEMIQCLIGQTPAGASTKQIMHFAQLKKYAHFASYREFWYTTEEYDLTKVTAPVVLYHSLNDWTNELVDVERLYDALPNATTFLVSDPNYNHIDFVYGDNNDEMLYDEVIANIQHFG